jgi:polysaccharide export outer membrane protein
MAKNSLFCAVLLLMMINFCSCSVTKGKIYFKDQQVSVQQLDSIKDFAIQRIQKSDRINITVTSTEPSLMAFLNPFGNAGGNNNNGLVGYLVDLDGNIEFPLIGKIQVNGLTTKETENIIKSKLAFYYKDLFVNVSLSGKVYMINGNEGSTINITNERLTILEAITQNLSKSEANDKSDVWIVREDSGKRYFSKIDLTSKKIFESPYFFLRSNDFIYIMPNKYNWLVSPTSPVRLTFTLFVSIAGLIILVTKLII